jgi:hypothetical protein
MCKFCRPILTPFYEYALCICRFSRPMITPFSGH